MPRAIRSMLSKATRERRFAIDIYSQTRTRRRTQL